MRNTMFGRKIAAARNGGTPARLLVLGHSHVAGEGSGSSDGLVDAGRHGVAEKLAEKLSLAGISAIRSGWMGDYNTSVDGRDINSFDSRISAGAGWASYPTNIIMGGRHLSQSGDPGGNGPLSFEPGFPFEGARIWHPTAIGLSERLGVYLDARCSWKLINLIATLSLAPWCPIRRRQTYCKLKDLIVSLLSGPESSFSQRQNPISPSQSLEAGGSEPLTSSIPPPNGRHFTA